MTNYSHFNLSILSLLDSLSCWPILLQELCCNVYTIFRYNVYKYLCWPHADLATGEQPISWKPKDNHHLSALIDLDSTVPPSFLSHCSHEFNNNNNNRIQRRYSRFFTISSQRHELSSTRMLKRPGHNRVQITCNTSSAYHVQVSCYVPLGTKGQLSY